MQQLDAVTLKALAAELQALLENAKVSKVQHPSPHEFLITFWGGPVRPDNLNLFYIQLNPEAPFCVLTQPKHRQETVLHTFAKPTALCMLLRKHLQGASLLQARTLPGERVLDLVFENFNELGNKVRLVLSLELMGKHSNMIFYDEVQGNILAVAHGVSDVMSSHRELAAGLPYAPPPKPVGKKLLAELTSADFQALLAAKPAGESMARFLNANLAGFGLRMLEDALVVSGEASLTLYRCLDGLENSNNLKPAIAPDGERFSLLKNERVPEGGQSFDSVNALVGSYFIGHLRTTRIRRKSDQLSLKLDQHEKKRQRREKELVPIADAEIEGLQATGDRLLAAFSAREVPEHPSAGKGTVAVTHYEDGSPWLIEIDPSASWIENAQLYYRRAKKAKARKDAYEQMADALNAERDYLANLRQLVSQAETLAELDALEADMAEAGFTQKAPKLLEGKKKKSGGDNDGKELAGVSSLRSSDGLEILLGKSGQGNDAIVGKLSRSDDWWLHVHQMPGSHVLIRAGKEEVPNQTLLEAASLAVYYSSARSGLNVPVVYTQCKHVRKIPQSYPGHVNYKQEQTVFISPDPALIQKLVGG